METIEKTIVSISVTVNAPIKKVWECWTTPEDIIHWCSGSNDWHTPRAENDLRVGGKFLTRMEAKDGSMGFDFQGVYQTIKTNELIEYDIEDGRKVRTEFTSSGNKTEIFEIFETESTNPVEMQRSGWQTILDNFKHYVESKK
jgi:uncharacterized protein YndB with AHSA1/START domain